MSKRRSVSAEHRWAARSIVKTLRIPEKFQSGASAGFGSYDTRKFSAFVSHKPSKWDYLIVADYLHSDNDFDMLNDNGTQWNDSDDRWEKRQASKQASVPNFYLISGFHSMRLGRIRKTRA